MPTRSLMAFAAVAVVLCASSQSASAFDALHRPDLPYRQFDPDRADALARYYHYYYDPRGYYPYHSSGEWGPPRINRFRGELPPYYASWGSTNRRYRHV